MKTTINFYHILFIAILLLTACSDSKSTDSVEISPVKQVAKTEIQELNWEDLMPEGEDVVLEKLYEEYYSEREKKFAETNDNSDAETIQGNDSFDLGEIAEGAANDTMDQVGTFNVVKSLNGQKVRIPGYIVPLDFNANSAYIEFLLVPYFGACLHTPPPPPNQIIFVKVDESTPAQVKSIYDPVWIEGELTTGEFSSNLASTAYELKLSKIEPYE